MPLDLASSCPNCGKPLGENAPMGLCPECLLKAGFGSVTDDGQEGGAKAFTPPTPEELGARFPQLEILELLGRGGMGAVYKARQKRLDRWVALKILPPGIGRDPSFAERFEREAKALAQLHHPHIVTLYEFGEAEGLFYFLMEFVDGLNLRQLLQAGRLAPKEALAIVPQICEALQYAHDRGIVHRDIKPENILLNKDGQVKIADFGVARIVARATAEPTGDRAVSSAEPLQTEVGKVIGTPQYMAPEQVSAPLEVDHRADIYALGVVFYQMLTGELPAARLEPPSRKVVLDVRLDEIVLRALEKEPDRRYQQASILKTQVETVANAPATKTAPPLKHSLLHFDGITKFRSITALRCAQLACVGFLGFLGNIPGWERWHGCFGFFGLLGLAYIVEAVAWRGHGGGGGGDDALSSEELPPTGPHFSRTALVAAGVAFLPWMLGVLGPVLTGPVHPNDRVLNIVMVACQLLAVAFAGVATLLGWVAVGQIRRSKGQLSGLGLAVFDGLFYPLLALDAVILGGVVIAIRAGMALTNQSPATTEWLPWLLVPVIIVACVAADFLVSRAVWRAVARPADRTPSAAWKWALGAVGAVGLPFCLLAAFFTVHAVNPISRPAEAVSFHYQVFEMDAADVDAILPLEARKAGVMPGIKPLANTWVTSLGGPASPLDSVFSDAQRGEVSVAGVSALLGKAGPPLAEQTHLIYNWPLTADNWSYSKADGATLGGGIGSGFLGARRVHGALEIRLEYQLSHSINALSDRHGKQWQSKILYQGQPAGPGDALVFLVPFSRPTGAVKYLVIVFDTSPAQPASQPKPLSQAAFGPVLERALPVPATGANCFLDLESGNLIVPPPNIAYDFGPEDETGSWDARFSGDKAHEMQRWLTEAGADVMAGAGHTSGPRDEKGLTIFDGLAAGPADWEKAIPDEIVATIRAVEGQVQLAGNASPFSFMRVADALPKSFVFKTRKGSVGILQITEVAPDSASVKFRYRLVQGDSGVVGSSPLMDGAPHSSVARLPGGASVELWGVAAYSPNTPRGRGKPRQWWSPDGTIIQDPPIYTEGAEVHPGEERRAREFVIRVNHLPPGADTWPEWDFESGSEATAGESVYLNATGKPDSDLRAVISSLPTSAKRMNLRLGFGISPWETVLKQAANAGSNMTGFNRDKQSWSVSFGKAEEVNGATHLTVVHTVRGLQMRVVAVDTAGREHAPERSGSSGTTAFVHLSLSFDHLPPAQISEFRFQVRPYAWAEFHDVALEPGQKTAMVVSTKPTPASGR